MRQILTFSKTDVYFVFSFAKLKYAAINITHLVAFKPITKSRTEFFSYLKLEILKNLRFHLKNTIFLTNDLVV